MEGNKEMGTEDPNFSTEMNRYRALELAIRDGGETPDQVVERAQKYADFIKQSPQETR